MFIEKLAGFTIVLLISIGCSTGSVPELTDAERTTASAAVESKVELFALAAAERDAQILAPMLAADVEFVDFARSFSGDAASLEWLEGLYGNFRFWQMGWDEITVDVLSGDAAVATAVGSLLRQRNDGRVQQADRSLLFTAVFQNVDGNWLATHIHLSGSVQTVETP